MHAYTICCRAQKRQAAHRRRQAKIDPFTYCGIPRTTRHGVVWEEIELSTQDIAKGVGLFAKMDLPKDLCIRKRRSGMGTSANATTVYRTVLRCNAWEKEARRSGGWWTPIPNSCKTAEYPPGPGLVVTATKPIGAKTWTQTCWNTMGNARSQRTNGWMIAVATSLWSCDDRSTRAKRSLWSTGTGKRSGGSAH